MNFKIRFLLLDFEITVCTIPSKSALKGTAIYSAYLLILAQLELIGVHLIGCVSDGAQPNVLKRVCRPNYYYLRFQVVTKEKGTTANWKFVVRLHSAQTSGKLGKSGLKLVPKLTRKHIDPNSFEKMRVSTAVQVIILSIF